MWVEVVAMNVNGDAEVWTDDCVWNGIQFGDPSAVAIVVGLENGQIQTHETLPNATQSIYLAREALTDFLQWLGIDYQYFM